MRISGLASGMDIEGIVKQMMMAERIPLDRMTQKKQILEWQREAYHNFNAKLMEFRNLAFDMRLQSTYLQRKVTVSDNQAVSVSAGASTPPGNYSLKVNQLATSAQLTSKESVGANDRNAKLESLIGDFGISELTISGDRGSATIRINPSDTINQVVQKINAQTKTTGVTANYDENLDRFFFISSSTGEQSRINFISDNDVLLTELFKLKEEHQKSGFFVTGDQVFANSSTLINEDMSEPQFVRIKYGDEVVDFRIDRDTTIGELINEINASDIGKSGVSAYLNSNGYLTFLTPDSSGDSEEPELTFMNVTPTGTEDPEYGVPSGEVDVLSSLGLSSVLGSDGKPINHGNHEYYGASGQNAKIEFQIAGGDFIEGEYDSNSFAINGIQFTLLGNTSEEININITADVDAAFEKIKSFVDKYNELIDEMNSALVEKRHRDYNPLVEWQKEEMSEKEIELWEERARSGLLRNDTILSRTVTNFRLALSEQVHGLPEGDLNQLFQIGITTGSYDEKGKLHINEARLKEVLAERPEEVIALFATDDEDSTTTKGDGIATRLYQIASTAMNDIRERAGFVGEVDVNSRIGKEITDLDERMRLFEMRLNQKETRFYQQFTQMEKFIDQMNQQSMYLMQVFFSNAQ